jgi:Helicase HerA, central domain
MDTSRSLYLGAACSTTGGSAAPLHLPPQHLVTHGVVLGMTGSGKTGLLTVLVEEALRAQVPVIMIDVKGDLPNLFLAFPSFAPEHFAPWVDLEGAASPERAAAECSRLAAERASQLGAWKISEQDLSQFREWTELRVLTPGSTAGEPLHILSSLERRSATWEADPEAGRAALSAALSLVLRMLGRDPNPAKSREHVLLAVLAERRLVAGQSAELSLLLEDLADPPIERLGALSVDEFVSPKDRARTWRPRSTRCWHHRRLRPGARVCPSTSASG